MNGIRPSRAWYWVALGLAVLSIAAAVVVGVRAVTGFSTPARIDPSGATVTLKKDGLTVYSSAPDVQVSCQVTAPSGAAVSMRPVTRNEEVSVNSVTWYAALRSERSVPRGVFDLKCDQPPGDIRLAVGPHVSVVDLVARILVAIVAATVAVIIAAVILLVTFLRRRTARRLLTQPPPPQAPPTQGPPTQGPPAQGPPAQGPPAQGPPA